MAHSMQAKKRIRQSNRRTLINKAQRSAIRTELRKVEEAIVGGDQGTAKSAFRQMQPRLMAGVNKGVMHKNTAARTLSRFIKRIKAMPVWNVCDRPEQCNVPNWRVFSRSAKYPNMFGFELWKIVKKIIFAIPLSIDLKARAQNRNVKSKEI